MEMRCLTSLSSLLLLPWLDTIQAFPNGIFVRVQVSIRRQFGLKATRRCKPARSAGATTTRLRWSARADWHTEDHAGDKDCVDVIFIQEDANDDFDLTSPRGWLEWHGRNGGAYTAMLCMYDISEDRWTCQGLDFHLARLVQSYDALMQKHNSAATPLPEAIIHQAKFQSQKIISSLLDECKNETAKLRRLRASQVKDDHGGHGGVSTDMKMKAMLTLLWDDNAGVDSNGSARPLVHGHATLIGDSPIARLEQRPPITATLAIDPSILRENQAEPDLQQQNDLPSRYQNHPTAKLSSWCWERRPLETMFKDENTGEVILTRKLCGDGDDNLELLEGLTTNVFVVYKDGRLKTADSQLVLNGYMRHEILRLADHIDMPVDQSPIRLSERGEWKEVFVTSSIRIATSVDTLNTIHGNHHDGSVTVVPLWSQSSEGGDDASFVSKIFDFVNRE